MPREAIRRLIVDRGYGSIQTDERRELFLHANDLVGVACESLTESQRVEFEITSTSKGSRAVIVALDSETK